MTMTTIFEPLFSVGAGVVVVVVVVVVEEAGDLPGEGLGPESVVDPSTTDSFVSSDTSVGPLPDPVSVVSGPDVVELLPGSGGVVSVSFPPC